MPSYNYYRRSPTLAEKLDLFIDHHHDPKNRHISKYEAEMLGQIRDLLVDLKADKHVE